MSKTVSEPEYKDLCTCKRFDLGRDEMDWLKELYKEPWWNEEWKFTQQAFVKLGWLRAREKLLQG